MFVLIYDVINDEKAMLILQKYEYLPTFSHTLPLDQVIVPLM